MNVLFFIDESLAIGFSGDRGYWFGQKENKKVTLSLQ